MLKVKNSPIYLQAYETGFLEDTIKELKKHLKGCRLCPIECGINRDENQGVCGAGRKIKLANAILHFGEEPPLSGSEGAGAVFFSGCSMRCIYCQNMGFSQRGIGIEMEVKDLSFIFLELQKAGARTLDLVTPTPHLPLILEALYESIPEGFNLPLVYNTSGYEKIETLKLLKGIVDVYLVDIRYTDDEMGLRYSKVPDYWGVTQKALKEMFDQVGPFNENEMKGVIIRLLVLPNGVSGTLKALDFIAKELSIEIPIAIMSQYIPLFKAREDPLIGRRITQEEYEKVLDYADSLGFENGWYQTDEVERVSAKAVPSIYRFLTSLSRPSR